MRRGRNYLVSRPGPPRVARCVSWSTRRASLLKQRRPSRRCPHAGKSVVADTGRLVLQASDERPEFAGMMRPPTGSMARQARDFGDAFIPSAADFVALLPQGRVGDSHVAERTGIYYCSMIPCSHHYHARRRPPGEPGSPSPVRAGLHWLCQWPCTLQAAASSPVVVRTYPSRIQETHAPMPYTASCFVD